MALAVLATSCGVKVIVSWAAMLFTDLAIRGWLILQRNADGLVLTRGEADGDAIREEERHMLDTLIAQKSGSLTLGGRYEPRLTKALEVLLKSFKGIEQNNFSNHTGSWLLGAFFALMTGIALLVTSTGDSEAANNAVWVMLLGVLLGAGMFYCLTHEMIGSALVGTFLGIFLAYGLVGPLANRCKQVIEADGAITPVIGPFAPGRSVTLRAEMEVIVVIANCPHVLDPRAEYASTPLRVTAWRGPVATDADPVRNATPEGQRAFLNTEDYYRR